MADKKRKLPAANKRRIDRLTRELSRVERQIACLQQRSDRAVRFDLLMEREVVLFTENRSKHMH